LCNKESNIISEHKSNSIKAGFFKASFQGSISQFKNPEKEEYSGIRPFKRTELGKKYHPCFKEISPNRANGVIPDKNSKIEYFHFFLAINKNPVIKIIKIAS